MNELFKKSYKDVNNIILDYYYKIKDNEKYDKLIRHLNDVINQIRLTSFKWYGGIDTFEDQFAFFYFDAIWDEKGYILRNNF